VACSVAAVGEGTQAVLAPAAGCAPFSANSASIRSGFVHMPLPICACPGSPQASPVSTFQSS
jgi:hypothetical protein